MAGHGPGPALPTHLTSALSSSLKEEFRKEGEGLIDEEGNVGYGEGEEGWDGNGNVEWGVAGGLGASRAMMYTDSEDNGSLSSHSNRTTDSGVFSKQEQGNLN